MNSRPLVLRTPEPRPLENASLVALADASFSRGTRVVAANEAGPARDLRVWEPGVQETIGGEALVLVTERAWWAWVLKREWPATVSWPLAAVWVEVTPA